MKVTVIKLEKQRRITPFDRDHPINLAMEIAGKATRIGLTHSEARDLMRDLRWKLSEVAIEEVLA